MPPLETENQRMGLPIRPFLYTVDQIAALLQMKELTLKTKRYIYYSGRSVGAKGPDRMMARNISPTGWRPDWRVAERELIRWLKRKGFRIYVEKHIQSGNITTGEDDEDEGDDD